MLNLNPEGCTLDTNYNTINMSKGYFVALTNNHIMTKLNIELKKLKQLARMLQLKNFYYGYWKDENTNEEYLDISIHVENKELALEIGRIHSQKAIFDCQNNDCIWL